MLRSIVLLLLLANLAFFSWSRGWLSPWLLAAPGPEMVQREPQRVAAQVRPEAIRVLGASDPETPAPAPDAPNCVQIGPVDAEGLNRAEDALERAGVPVQGWRRMAIGEGWLLRLDNASPDQQARLRELGRAQPSLGLAPCA